MAHWLSWKCSESRHTAREKVRVARALEALPLLTAEFSAGRISYCKVRAITRVACGADEADWVDIARETTGAGLDKMVAAVRRALDDEDDIARSAFERRKVERRSLDGGRARIVIEGPVDSIDVVWAAIDVVATKTIDDATVGAERSRREVTSERGGLAAVRFDAAEQVAERSVAAAGAGVERGDVGRLSVVLDDDFLSAVAAGDSEPDGECTLGGRRLAPEIALRWSCDMKASVMIAEHGHACDEGRATKVVNRKLRRALHRRDRGMCRFPGCGATTWLHAHHIRHWSRGGRTDLDNLLSLCGFHHHLVHEGGWTVAIHDGAIVWSDPDGTPSTVESLTGDADQLIAEQVPLEIDLDAIQARWAGRSPDFAFAVSVIVANSLRARKRATEGVPAGTPPSQHVEC